MEEKILNEITDFCESCKSHECCLENDCVLYRIEQITLNKNKTYQVEVKEELCRIVEVEAESEEAAVDIVERQYRNEEIVLDAEDYIETDIKIFGGNK